MNLRESLAHAWVTIGVPGTTHPRTSTYVLYPEDGLPPLPVAVSQGDGLEWLRGLPAVGTGMTPDEWSHTTTPLSRAGVERLLQTAGASAAFDGLPADLRALSSDEELPRRLFSATDAYVDAAERLAPVQGGHLLHLVSDSQWVFHWLAFIGDDGSTGVVCSAAALGYSDDTEDDGAPDGGKDEPVWVADSVAEFIWRWWADNYAFAAAYPDHCPPLSAPDWFDLAAYTAGYTAPGIEPSWQLRLHATADRASGAVTGCSPRGRRHGHHRLLCVLNACSEVLACRANEGQVHGSCGEVDLGVDAIRG